MASLATLRGLGYTVAVAHGDADTERAALADARTRAGAERLQADVEQVAARAAAQAAAQGLDVDVIAAIVAAAASAAFVEIRGARTAEVELLERAVAIAEGMPTVYVVDGPAVHRIYVACKEDGTGADESQQAILDALADPAGHAERVYQSENRGPMQAAATLRGLGYTVERPEAGKDVFTVGGETKTGKQLVAAAEAVAADPPARPTVPERVAGVLLTAPELGDETRAALEAALQPLAPQLP